MQNTMGTQRTATRYASQAGGKALARGGAQISEMFDIEDSLGRAVRGFEDVEGPQALVLGILFLLLSVGLLGLVVLFDLVPTAQFSLAQTAAYIPANAAFLGGAAGLLLTMVPSLIEMVAPSLLRRGIKVSYLPVAGALGFDAVSDLPACNAFVSTLDPLFERQFGTMAGVAHDVALLLWTLCATVGFEALLAITAFVTIQLLWQSQRHSKAQQWRGGR